MRITRTIRVSNRQPYGHQSSAQTSALRMFSDRKPFKFYLICGETFFCEEKKKRKRAQWDSNPGHTARQQPALNHWATWTRLSNEHLVLFDLWRERFFSCNVDWPRTFENLHGVCGVDVNFSQNWHFKISQNLFLSIPSDPLPGFHKIFFGIRRFWFRLKPPAP